ncbi:MAG: hypothetical protein ABIP06_04705 [Pyrinomonadaceae bacterium]
MNAKQSRIYQVFFSETYKTMKSLIICFLFFGTFQFTYGQPGAPPTNTTRPTGRDINERDFEDRRRALQQLNNGSLNGSLNGRINVTIRVKKTLTKEERQRREKILAPRADDLLKYKNFLQQPKTGIFRLLPDFDCETKYLVRADSECANFVIFGSAYSFSAYSFRDKGYSDADFHDISFKREFLVSDSLLMLGIFVSLGDASLDNLSLTSDGLKFLTEFKPENDRQLVEKQLITIRNGIQNNGYLYSDKIKPEENVTYALRVVAYKYKDKDGFRFRKGITSADESKFLSLKYDERKDVLLVFRIIEKNSDGGITIIWKELQREDSPTITFQKNEKLRDIKLNKKDESSN